MERSLHAGVILFSELDLAVLFLIFLNAVAYENEYLAVSRAPLVVGYDVELVQHFLINSYRQTFYGHNITPI